MTRPDYRQLRIAKWERAQKHGFLKFVITRGLGMTVFMWAFVVVHRAWNIGQIPPADSVGITLLYALPGGLIWAVCYWFITKWAAENARNFQR